MKIADILSIVRYAVTFGGGVLANKGLITANEIETAIGVASGLTALLASQIARAKVRRAARLASPDHTAL